MQITLGDSDIRQALLDYITNQGINTKNKEALITVRSGRRGNGLSADINLEEINMKQVQAVTPPVEVVSNVIERAEESIEDPSIELEENVPEEGTTSSLFGG